jgi:hypothetical protein
VAAGDGLLNRYTPHPTPYNSETCDTGREILSRFLAHLAQESPELVDVAKAWPRLPAALKAGILAMIRNVSQGPACK